MSNRSQDPASIVANGYDQVSTPYFQYYRTHIPDSVDKHVALFADRLQPDSEIVELGCGNGLPFTAQLAKHHNVTGIDISPVQIERAIQNVPKASFSAQDMTEVSFSDDSLDGVLALYSIIHVPREKHANLLGSIYRWLKPGGLFLASMGSSDSKQWIEEDWFGAPMYWSHFGPETNSRLIADTGFESKLDEVTELVNPHDGEIERHHWILAKKPAL